MPHGIWDVMKIKKLNESKVGIFYYIKNKVYSDAIDVRDGDSYGDFVNYANHYEYWDRLTDRNPALMRIPYDYFPRGRVVYNKQLHKYILYMDKRLDNPEALSAISSAFNLQRGGYEIDLEDEHYSSFPENLKVRI